MAFKISTTARNAMAAALAALFNAGSGPGYMQIRTGAAPTNPEDANSGTLLATLAFSDPAFGSPSTGTVTADTITSDTSIDATGTAGHFRVFDSDDNCIASGSITATGGGGDMTFNTVSFVAGGTCAITSFAVTVPQ